MPIRLDLKKIPEVAALPIDHRVRIERRSLFLAATDWWTISAIIVMCLPLAFGFGFMKGLPEGQQWPLAITGFVAEILFFLLVFFARANHHAVRIARLATSLLPEGSPAVVPQPPPPASKSEPLPGWRKAAGLAGVGAGLSLFYLGASTPHWYLLGAGAVTLVAGGVVGTSWTLCRVCQNLNVGLWTRSDRCASCGTSFRGAGTTP